MTTEKSRQVNIFEIEERRSQLIDYLNHHPDSGCCWEQMISFFELLFQQPEQNRFQSYFVELAPYYLHLADQSFVQNKSPRYLELHLQILSAGRPWLQSTGLVDRLNEVEKKLRITTALTYLYLADTSSACRVLGWDIKAIPADSELQTAMALIESATSRNFPHAQELSQFVDKWRRSSLDFSAESLHVLLVEKDEYSNKMHGRMLDLKVHTKERPRDAEEDMVRINNSMPTGDASLFFSLTDAIRAANLLIFSSADRDIHYHYHYSLTDKEVEFSGRSIGLAAGLLAFAGRHNRHYRTSVVTFSNATAVTGSLALDGQILPVDSHSLTGKVQAAFFSPIKRIYVPAENLLPTLAETARLKALYPYRFLEVTGVHSLQHAANDRNLVQKKAPSILARFLAAIQRVRNKSALFSLVFISLAVILFSQIRSLQWWRQPTHWEVQENYFIMNDQYGDKMWSHRFDFFTEPEGRTGAPVVTIDDLDGDGAKETLVSFSHRKKPQYSALIYCFSRKGKLLWPGVKLSKTLYTRSDILLQDLYIPAEIRVVDLFNQHNKMILVTIRSWVDFPSAIVLLDPQGKICGEYWTAGHIESFTTSDLNQDGINEIILWPADNETGRTRLIVLDPRNMHGASPQQDENYILRDLAPGSQLACLRFPPSPFSSKKWFRDRLLYTEIVDQQLRVCVANVWEDRGINPPQDMYYYLLSSKLELIGFEVYDSFRSGYRNTFKRDFTPEEEAKLKKIEYWEEGKYRESQH